MIEPGKRREKLGIGGFGKALHPDVADARVEHIDGVDTPQGHLAPHDGKRQQLVGARAADAKLHNGIGGSF